MKTKSVLLALFALFFSELVIAQQPDPVMTDCGLIQGSFENGLTVYKGVPFAAPPVGELRWKAPQPVKKWEGVKQTTAFAPGPPQGQNFSFGKSEDCLYLNVWSPAKTAKDRIPVLVWIHGGGFSAGAASEQMFNGENLAKKGVVLVCIAYRIGQLGFLAHPELSAESPNHVSGNYGLLDMIAALQWIQKNIAVMGGDPKKVTIFGESAGGIAVSMLCASPLAKGLFSGAICESGGSFGPASVKTASGENMKLLKDAEQSGVAFAKNAGATSIAELRKMDADKLSAGMGIGMAWPNIDGYVIPDDQYKLYEAGKYNDVPVLIGYNSDEGASFSRTKTPEEYFNAVKSRYEKFADDLIKAYPAGATTVPKTARDLDRDAAFGWHTWSWARLQSKTGKSKVYYYYFDQHPDYPEGSSRYGQGSTHGSEIVYVFQHLSDSNPMMGNNQSTPSDKVISDAMATYWTNFAKYGNPNGAGVPEWPAFSEANPKVMYFNKTPYIGPVPSADALKVLDGYFSWRRTPEGQGMTK